MSVTGENIPNNRMERDSGKAADGLTGAVHPERSVDMTSGDSDGWGIL